MLTSTPDNITHLEEWQVFVFGSNRAGRHGAGAAKLAHRKFGAKWGQGDGLMGQSYGISTKDRNLGVLPIRQIEIGVDRLLRFAEAHPEKEFLVTKIGCGLAGYSVREIATCFTDKHIPGNVVLPEEFQQPRR